MTEGVFSATHWGELGGGVELSEVLWILSYSWSSPQGVLHLAILLSQHFFTMSIPASPAALSVSSLSIFPLY